jgi:hypothetical protein
MALSPLSTYTKWHDNKEAYKRQDKTHDNNNKTAERGIQKSIHKTRQGKKREICRRSIDATFPPFLAIQKDITIAHTRQYKGHTRDKTKKTRHSTDKAERQDGPAGSFRHIRLFLSEKKCRKAYREGFSLRLLDVDWIDRQILLKIPK